MSGYPQIHPRTRLVSEAGGKIRLAINEAAQSGLTYLEISMVLAQELAAYCSLGVRAERNAQCPHERLNEDGICRACGADRRGI